jgi:tetratricopeptide (TPR) repeat protein
MWGIISLLILSTAAMGLLLSSLADPTGPAALVTAGSSRRAVTAGAVLPFSEDAFGMLILLDTDQDEAGQLAAKLDGDLRAALVESGLSNQVESDVRLATGLPLEEEAARQRARLAVLIQAEEEAGSQALAARAFLNEAIQPAGFSQYVPAMQATMDALLAPFSAPSMAESSQIMANRLTAIANTAAGTVALHDGAYSDCTRRFTAVLALLAQIDLAFKRAEASHASLAICLDALGENDEARSHYQAAIDINPDYSLAYYGLGNYYYGQDNYARAKLLYKETVNRSFSDPLSSDEIISRAYVGLGNLALIDGDYPAAVADLDRAAGLMPDFPATYLARALARRAQGQETAAQADLIRCLELASQAEPRQSDYFRQVEAECRALLTEMTTKATPSPTNTAMATATPVPTRPEDRKTYSGRYRR